MEPPFDLAVVVDDDPDIALAARLALRDLFERDRDPDLPGRAAAFHEARGARRDPARPQFRARRRPTAARASIISARIMAEDPDAAVVIITAHGAVSVAVEAIKRGASDFVAKPWSNERLAATVRSAAALRRSKHRSADRARPRIGSWLTTRRNAAARQVRRRWSGSAR